LDVHHVLKRAQGGSDFALDRLVALCRACHDRTDASYAKGRLVVRPLGDGRFAFMVMRGAGKWGAEVEDQWESLGSLSAGGHDALIGGFAHVGKTGEKQSAC
jgi:5-methylcytosine-specific restriction endonuclease McrA